MDQINLIKIQRVVAFSFFCTFISLGLVIFLEFTFHLLSVSIYS